MSRVPSLSSPFLLGFDEIERMLDRVAKGADGYPPYNIERLPRDGQNPERLRITLAVAGFTRDQLDVSIEESQLVIRGRQQDDKTRQYLHRGIAARQFQRTFVLADGMEVLGADLQERIAVDRSGPAAAGTDREDDRDQRPGMTELETKQDSTASSVQSKGVEGHDQRQDDRTEWTTHPAITQEALAHLGDGRLAYVKPIRSEDVAEMFPQAPQIAPGIDLFALHAADGTPIMLTDTREAAVANAWSQELEP